MIPGGIADKLGNDYEDLWVARQFLSVYTANAQAITGEPISDQGFEFFLEVGKRVEWHQCKMRGTGGQWTINRLESAGVLSAFAKKLPDENNHGVFVSDADAQAFRTLGNKARLTDSIGDFRDALSKNDSTDFKTLVALWNIDEWRACEWLKRCRTETVSPDFIMRALNEMAALLFVGQTDLGDALQRYSRDRLTRRTTTEEMRSALPGYGLMPRANALDPTVRQSIDAAADSFLEQDASRRPNVVIDRSEIVEVALDWYENGSERHLFFSGGAGTGKSFVVAELSKGLRKRGVTVLPFRLDRYLSLSRPVELGEELLDLESDPTSVLANPGSAKQPVLIVDQLDAVSDASGRRRAAKELVFRLIQSNERLRGAKVVLVCRDYDLTNDSRIEQLAKSDTTKTITVPSLDWKADVEPALGKADIEVTGLTERQRNLLCLPSCLAAFVRLVGTSGHTPAFTTSNDLIEQLVDLAEKEVGEDESWSVWSALGKVAARMSADQTLSSPSAVLDEFRNGRNRLQSAGLVTVDHGQIQFQHESYFDVIYARDFVATGKRLEDWLTDDEQQLFRRTQVRQILAYMRLSAPADYRRDLRSILSNPDIRYHIKDAVASWLSDLTGPTGFELDAVLSLSGAGKPDRLTRKAIFGKGWLGILISSGILDEWLRQDEPWKNCALTRLRIGMENDPRSCTDVLRRFLLDRPDETVNVLNNLGFLRVEREADLVADFLCELIATLPARAFETDQRFDKIWAGWSGKHASVGARIMAAWYRRWMVLNPLEQPFLKEGSERRRPDYHAKEMVEKAPGAFLTEVGPLFLEALARPRDGWSHAGELMWEVSIRSETWGGLVTDSLKAVANDAPEVARKFASLIAPDCDPVLLRYRLAAIASGGEACADFFVEVIDHPNLFEAGGYTLRWKGAAEAARAVRPFLRDLDWQRLEDRVFTYRPEHERIARIVRESKAEGRALREIVRDDPWLTYELRRNGYEQWAIAQHIGFKVFSSRYQAQLNVLKRKFVNEPEPKEETSKGGTVGSPIKSDALEKMNDAAWLSAMRSYDSEDSREYLDDYVRGGARELAHVLRERTKQEPERFAALLYQIPSDINPVYPAEILEGLRGSDLPDEDLLCALQYVGTFPSDDGERAFIYLVSSRPALLLDDRVFLRVIDLVKNGPPPSFGRSDDDDPNELQGAYSVETIFDRHSGGGFYSYGSAGCRLAALKAVNAALWEKSLRYEELADLVDERVDEEADSDVLALLVEPILAISTQERERGFILLARLARRDLRIVATQPAIRGYNWARCQRSEHLEFLYTAMFSHGHPALEALALLWMSGEVLIGERPLNDYEPYMSDSAIARRAAALAAKDFLYDIHGAELAMTWLETFASDDDPDVKRQAYRLDWHAILEEGGKPLRLVEQFIASEAFLQRSERLTMRLDDLADQHPRLALEASKRLVAFGEDDDEFIRTQMGHGALTNVGKMIMGAYEGFGDDAPERQDALDLFDRFLAADIYDVDQVITRYERH